MLLLSIVLLQPRRSAVMEDPDMGYVLCYVGFKQPCNREGGGSRKAGLLFCECLGCCLLGGGLFVELEDEVSQFYAIPCFDKQHSSKVPTVFNSSPALCGLVHGCGIQGTGRYSRW